MKITVKSYKSCRGNEGDAFSCTVYLDGKRSATVQYDGWGGEYLWDFTYADGRMYGGEVCKKLEEYCAGLPKERTSIPDEEDPTGFWHMQPDMSTLLDDVLKEMLVEKQLKGWCRTKIVYRFVGQPEGEYFQWKCAYAKIYGEQATRDIVRAMLERQARKEGQELEEIVNDRFVKKAKAA